MQALNALMRPQSIAVIGATDRPSAMGNTILHNFRRMRFGGRLYGVHPTHRSIEGVECFPSITELPERVDAVAICLSSDKVLKALTESIEAGVRAAAIFASGFAEIADGRELEAELQALCAAHGVAVVGPNCLGLLNVNDGIPLYTSALPDEMPPGDVAVLSQSGSACIAMICSGRVQPSFVVSSGNEATTTLADYLDYVVDDEATRVITVVAESIRDPERFAAAADRALLVGKPVIVLKVGRSADGRRAAAAHTGSLIGPFEEYAAYFRKHGVILVDDFDELIETADVLRRIGWTRGNGLAIMNLSGGENAMICDIAERLDLAMPVLTSDTVERLSVVLPSFASISNPLDGTGVAVFDMEMYGACVRELAGDPNVDLLAISHDMPIGLDPVHVRTVSRVAQTVVDAIPDLDVPVVFLSNIGSSVHPEVAQILSAAGVPVLQGTRESLTAISNLFSFSRNVRRAQSSVGTTTKSPLPPEQLVELRSMLSGRSGALDPASTDILLEAYNIGSARGSVVSSADDAVELAETLGYPVVIKVSSADILHKTEVGGVRVGIADGPGLRTAWTEMSAAVRAAAPDAHVDGFLVQRQLSGGTEVLVGARRSADFGTVVVCGPGGVMVEIMGAPAMRLAPLDDIDASTMVDETVVGRLLAGFRGGPAGDRSALEELLVRVGHLVADLGDLIEELDLNPVVVSASGEGVAAVDALVILNAHNNADDNADDNADNNACHNPTPTEEIS